MKHKSKVKSRSKQSFGKNALLVGFTSIGIGLLIYNFVGIPWLFDSFQELIGFGLISIIAGLFFIFFGKKANF